MTTLTQIVASVVVQSSAAALSHFGVTLEPAAAPQAAPVVERVVARTPQTPEKLANSPKPPARRAGGAVRV